MRLLDMSLSRRHREIIKKHHYRLYGLATGSRKPVNATEIHFVDVCNGKFPARTEEERAYLAFLVECRAKSSTSKKAAAWASINRANSHQANEPIGINNNPNARPWVRYEGTNSKRKN